MRLRAISAGLKPIKTTTKSPEESMDHFNGLSPAEAERLALLLEECGEVQQIIGKILRHGYDSYHPDDPHRTPNRALLEKELGDLRAAIRLMIRECDVSEAEIGRAYTDKTLRLSRWLHHQPRTL